MTKSQTVYILAGLLILAFGMPGVSLAVTGCSNANLIGTYNVQISSAALTGVLNALNAPSPSGGSTGSTGSGSSGATASQTVNPGGFGNNPKSFGGATPGVGRYYLDGNGNIVGQGTGNQTQAIIGSYTVNTDCTVTMSLQTGETFNAVASADGSTILFVQSNAGQGGAVGEFVRGSAMCPSGSGVRTFGFSAFGAKVIQSGSGSTAAPTFGPASAVGIIALNDQGGFNLQQWSYTTSGFKQTVSTGSYTIGSDCNLHLTFASTTASGGTTGSVSSPMSFSGLLITDLTGQLNGVVVEQADANTIGLGNMISQ
jgi:hypothetical protein